MRLLACAFPFLVLEQKEKLHSFKNLKSEVNAKDSNKILVRDEKRYLYIYIYKFYESLCMKYISLL